MSYKENQGPGRAAKTAIYGLALIVGALLGHGIGAVTEEFSERNQPEKVYSADPFARGNAPQGGGLNESDGPGQSDPNPQLPPDGPYIAPPAPVVVDETSEMKCSKPVISADPRYNYTVPFMVPEGWSVWRCIEERWPDRGDTFIANAIENLQWYINYDPTLSVRDADVVPVGYTFYMGGDGAGAQPGKQ